jgi:type VI secretion system protein ImpM
MDPIEVPGWYGKLPALGDFASRRLPKPLVECVDTWLQAGIAASRAELDEQWLDVYLHAPIQRFWLAAGLCDARAWSGVLMPSVDRVGRHFPLLIATQITAAGDALPEPSWFRTVEQVALAALDLNATVDELELRLARLDGPQRGGPLLEGDERLAANLAETMARDGAARSVWWIEDSHGRLTARAFAALPPSPEFVHLLQGWPDD